MSSLKNRMFKKLLIKKRIINKLKPRERNDFQKILLINIFIIFIITFLFFLNLIFIRKT